MKDNTALNVKQRFLKMEQAKTPIRDVWDGTKELYYVYQDWVVNGESYDKPVRLPTLRDVTMSLIDKFMLDPPNTKLRPGKEAGKGDDSKVRALQTYIDNFKTTIHEKKIRRQVVEDMFHYGSGFRMPLYYDLKRKYNGELEELYDDLASIRINPEDVFIDENALQLHDKLRLSGARDVIVRYRYSRSTFIDLFKERTDVDLSKIKSTGWYSYETDTTASDRELEEKSGAYDIVKVYEYMNQETDEYILVANDTTILYDSLKKAKGTNTLPLVQYIFEPRNDSAWGTSLPELIAPHIYLKDTLINLEIMNLKLTLQPVLAMSGDFGFNKNVHVVRPGAVWRAGGRLNGKLQDNVQPLVIGNPNTNFYNFHNLLSGELSVTSRSDLRNLEFQENKTATEVVSQNKSMNTHVEHIENINEVEAEGVFVELLLQIMRTFMSCEETYKGKKIKRRVRVDGYVVNQDEGNPTFTEIAGAEDFFELTDEIIDTDVEVEVVDMRSAKASDMEQLGRLLQAIPIIGNIAQLDPKVLEKINFFGILEQLAEYLNLDYEKTFKYEANDYADKYKMMRDEIILGNMIEIPQDETREDSLERIKQLRKMRYDNKGKEKKQWKEYNKRVVRAWNFHMMKAMENVTKQHYDIIEQQQMEQKLPMPQAGPMPQVQKIPLPNEELRTPQTPKEARPNQIIK